MSHSPREHRTVARAMDHLTAVLHRPIESHDGTCLATRLWLVAQTFDASFACHHVVSVQWPLAVFRRDGCPPAGPLPRAPHPQFPTRTARFGSPVTPCGAPSSLAHTHTAVTCEMRPSLVTLHALDKGVDPSFDIPPDSYPSGSRLRQHQQRLPAHLCPPRSGLPSRFLETISPPSRQLRAPVSQNSNPSRPKYLQTPVTRNPATSATVRVRRLPSDLVRLATRPKPSYPSSLHASQRISLSGPPSRERGGRDSISGFPKIFIHLGANQITSFPVAQFIPASPSTSCPVDESARDETTVWLPNR